MMRALSVRFTRRFGSPQLPVLILVALLQRGPVLRLMAAAESAWAGASPAHILKVSAAVASLLGVIDTLAGATPRSPAVVTPASARAGLPYAADFAVTGVPRNAASYSVSGLPPGLSVVGASFSAGSNTYALNAPFGSITGTPTAAGNFPLTITAWEFPSSTGASRTYGYSLTVSPAPNSVPVITTQPASQTVIAGASVTFTTGASGAPAPTFQWQKNGVNIAGATGYTYGISGVTGADAGNYTVTATNSSGSTASEAAVLTVIVAPSDVVITITIE